MCMHVSALGSWSPVGKTFRSSIEETDDFPTRANKHAQRVTSDIVITIKPSFACYGLSALPMTFARLGISSCIELSEYR